MKRLLTILFILNSVASFGQSYQSFVKDSTIFRPQINAGAVTYTRGIQWADTFRIAPRDTTWHPLRTGTMSVNTGVTELYGWDGSKWNVFGGGGGGGGLVTASNGLTAVSTDVRLGGTLTQNTTIAGDAFGLTFSRASGVSPTLTLTGNTTNNTLSVASTNTNATAAAITSSGTISATLNTATLNRYPLEGYNSLGTTLLGEGGTASLPTAIFKNLTSGAVVPIALSLENVNSDAQQGTGISQQFMLYHGSGSSNRVSNSIISRWGNTPVPAAGISDFVISGYNAGTTNELLTLNAAGGVKLNQYTTSNFYQNDTSSYKPLVVSSNGTIYRSSWLGSGGGGGGSPVGNYGNVQLNRNSSFATPASDSLSFNSANLNIKGGLSTTNNVAFGTGVQGERFFVDGNVRLFNGNVYIDESLSLPGIVAQANADDSMMVVDASDGTVGYRAALNFSGLANRLPRWSSASNITYTDSIFVDNSDATSPKIGFGTNAPTATITIDSARGVNNPFRIYRSAISGLNTSYFSIRPGIFGWYIGHDATGSGFYGNLYLNSNSAYIESNGNGVFNTVGSATSVSGQTYVSAPIIYGSLLRPTPGLFYSNFDVGSSASSGQSYSVGIFGEINESGTAGRAVFKANPSMTAIGSGKYMLVDLGTRNTSNNDTAKWRIFVNGHTTILDSTDNGYALDVNGTTRIKYPLATRGSTPTYTLGTGAGTGATASITGNDASGYITINTGTTPTLGANIITVTFSTALTNTPTSIQLRPANDNASVVNARFYPEASTASTSQWIIKNSTNSAMPASQTLVVYYTITQ